MYGKSIHLDKDSLLSSVGSMQYDRINELPMKIVHDQTVLYFKCVRLVYMYKAFCI